MSDCYELLFNSYAYVLQKGCFWLAIWTLSHDDLGSFGKPFDTYRFPIKLFYENDVIAFVKKFYSFRLVESIIFSTKIQGSASQFLS